MHVALCLNDKHLSAALEYLYKKASHEVKCFNSEKMIQKIAVEHNGILYSKARFEESLELRAVGHLVDYVNLECFTSVLVKKLQS